MLRERESPARRSGIDTPMDPKEHTGVAALLTMPFRPKPSERRD